MLSKKPLMSKTKAAILFLCAVPCTAFAQNKNQRVFEIELLNFSGGMSNSFINTTDLIKQFYGFIADGSIFSFDALTIDKMLSTNVQMFLQPVKITKRARAADTKNEYARYEFWTNIETKIFVDISSGAIDAAREILENSNNPSAIDITAMHGSASVAGYVFWEAGFAISKNIINKNFWIRAAPSVFVPFAYIKQHTISLDGYTSGVNGFMGIKGVGDINLYTPVSVETLNYSTLPRSAGIDITLNTLYNFFSWLSAGADISHIPLIPANLMFRSTMGLNIDVRVPDPNYPWTQQQLANINLNEISMDYGWELNAAESLNYYCIRPVHFDFFANFKPFRSNLFIIKPVIGFVVNSVLGRWLPSYAVSFSVSLPIILSVEAGTAYSENTFQHKLIAVFNFKYFEIAAGIFIQGQDFTSSWNANGLGLNFALRFGK